MPRSLTAQDLSYVAALARPVWESVGRAFPFEDLVAYGSIGLVEAAERYTPGHGTTFTSFAYWRIRGAMFDGLREMGWYGRSGGFRGRAGLSRQMRPVAAGQEALFGVAEAVAALSRVEREILLRCEVGGETLEAAGAAIGLSKSWACRLRQRALDQVEAARAA